ncbi:MULTISPECIES: TrmH family RNA methyltransferase [unclassified Prochlorococcus]|uniref:TrmH family RNA methyltransferase n=1 Tax=unclassified Prochlorococcus TaxID=2627481 RepID=UPI0005657562|nr:MULTISPECIES: RNA methyltransferase [unclassified Prochlorococcus]
MISSRRNPLVKRLRSLSSAKGRSKASMLLLEGTNLLCEALKADLIPSEIITTPEWIEKNKEIFNKIPNEIELHLVTQLVLRESLSTVSPDGIASLLPLYSLPKLKKEAEFILALDRIQDPGNLGTLFRTALAAEIEIIWIAMGADPLSQKVLRSSAGALIHLPFKRLGVSEENALEQLSSKLKGAITKGFQVVGAYKPSSCINKRILPYWEIDWDRPTVLVLGNEGAGLHPRIQDCCTHAVTLPHNEIVESLNVASAAVPLLLERLRTKMTS